jgi:hypothetical protein
MLRQTCVSASGGICGAHSAFRCIRAVKCRRTIFLGGVRPVWTTQKLHRDMLRRTCVFHPVGFEGHVVHSRMSGVRNVHTLIFMLTWPGCGLNKKRTRTRCVGHLFLH